VTSVPYRFHAVPNPSIPSDWLYETKHDGFRTLAYIENGQCDLVSRNGKTFRQFKDLALWMRSGSAGRMWHA